MIEGVKFTVEDVMAVARFRERSKRNQDGWLVRCPAHEDAEPSCSVTRGDNGFAKLKCFTGCDNETLHRAFVAAGVVNRWESSEPAERLREVGRREWIIRNLDGEPVLLHRRIDYAKRAGERKARKDFKTLLATGQPIPRVGQPGHVALSSVLYGLEKLREYPDRVVVICEGEKAADAARGLGMSCALGTVGASVKPDESVVRAFKDRQVIFWRDADDAGSKQAEMFREALRGTVERFAVFVNPEADPFSGDDAADFAAAGHDLDDFSDAITDSMFEVRPPWPEDVRPLYAALKEAVEIIDRVYAGDTSRVIPTGYRALDRVIRGGLEPGEVYLLGAPTGGGKTTIMQSFAERIAARGPVLFVTPEMTAASMAIRAIVRASGQPFDSISEWRYGKDRALSEMMKVYVELATSKLPILLFDKPDVTMDEIENCARRIPNLKAVVIDYAQQVASIDTAQARYLQVGEVATRSTVIAKALGVPILLASQVNRSLERAANSKRLRPLYSFRETAMLEHKASVVLIFDRAIDKDGDPVGEFPDTDEVPALLSCIKNRHGAQFEPVDMRWDRPRYRVRQAEPEEARAQEPVQEADLIVVGADAPALPPAQGNLLE